jgi:DNA-binding response OmpR family regulator
VASTSDQPTPTKPRLLLVEDDPATSKALRAIFGRRGWDVAIATTLREARAYLTDGLDCIILDLMLPDGDGIAILKEIRDNELPVRVAVTTGISDARRLKEVSKLGPELLLLKPVNLQELLDGLGVGS